MNRRAMDIIMASSWAGKPMRDMGRNKRSSPSVRAMGEVVRVSSWVPSTSRMRRRAMYTAIFTPVQDTVMNFQAKITSSPAAKNTLRKKVSRMIKRMGLMPLASTFKLTLAARAAAAMYKNSATYPRKPRTRNTVTIMATVSSILVRGSMRCSRESPG